MFPVDFCGLRASQQANGTATTPLRKKRPHFSGGTVVALHDSHPQPIVVLLEAMQRNGWEEKKTGGAEAG